MAVPQTMTAEVPTQVATLFPQIMTVPPRCSAQLGGEPMKIDISQLSDLLVPWDLRLQEVPRVTASMMPSKIPGHEKQQGSSVTPPTSFTRELGFLAAKKNKKASPATYTKEMQCQVSRKEQLNLLEQLGLFAADDHLTEETQPDVSLDNVGTLPADRVGPPGMWWCPENTWTAPDKWFNCWPESWASSCQMSHMPEMSATVGPPPPPTHMPFLPHEARAELSSGEEDCIAKKISETSTDADWSGPRTASEDESPSSTGNSFSFPDLNESTPDSDGKIKGQILLDLLGVLDSNSASENQEPDTPPSGPVASFKRMMPPVSEDLSPPPGLQEDDAPPPGLAPSPALVTTPPPGLEDWKELPTEISLPEACADASNSAGDADVSDDMPCSVDTPQVVCVSDSDELTIQPEAIEPVETLADAVTPAVVKQEAAGHASSSPAEAITSKAAKRKGNKCHSKLRAEPKPSTPLSVAPVTPPAVVSAPQNKARAETRQSRTKSQVATARLPKCDFDFDPIPCKASWWYEVLAMCLITVLLLVIVARLPVHVSGSYGTSASTLVVPSPGASHAWATAMPAAAALHSQNQLVSTLARTMDIEVARAHAVASALKDKLQTGKKATTAKSHRKSRDQWH